jgi:hypothetical protein
VHLQVFSGTPNPAIDVAADDLCPLLARFHASAPTGETNLLASAGGLLPATHQHDSGLFSREKDPNASRKFTDPLLMSQRHAFSVCRVVMTNKLPGSRMLLTP